MKFIVVIVFVAWFAYIGINNVIHGEKTRLSQDEWTELTTKVIGYQPGWKSPYDGRPWVPFSNVHGFESKVWTTFDDAVACDDENCVDIMLTIPDVQFGAGLYIDQAWRETACDQSLYALDINQADIQESLRRVIRYGISLRADIADKLSERPGLWADVVRDCKPS